MEEDKNKNKLAEIYTEIQVLQQQLDNLEHQIKDVDRQEQDLNTAVEAIKNIKRIDDNQESLIPVVNGVFVKAKIIKSDKVLVNIGANTIVEKTMDETIDMLNKNISEIKSYREKILVQYQNVVNVLELRQKSLNEQINKQQNKV